MKVQGEEEEKRWVTESKIAVFAKSPVLGFAREGMKVSEVLSLLIETKMGLENACEGRQATCLRPSA
jgi:hypothetical protein